MMKGYHSKEGSSLFKYLTFSSSQHIDSRATLFTYSREAIFQMMLVNKIGEKDIILMPSYQCNTVIDAILPFTKNIEFYTIDKNLLYSISEIKRKINKNVKMIFFVHYFGVIHELDDELNQVLLKENIKIVHDLAHSFLSFYEKKFTLKREGDYIISSIYKNIPLGVGAIGIGEFQMKNGIDFHEFFLINLKKILTHIRCSLGKRAFTYYELHDSSTVKEEVFVYKNNFLATKLYKFFLSYLNLNKIISDKRNISYNYFNLFERNEKFFNVFEKKILDTNILQAYPLRCEDKVLQKKLFDFLKKDCIDIYPWPSYHPMNNFDKLKENFLLLPLDQYSFRQTKVFFMENLYE